MPDLPSGPGVILDSSTIKLGVALGKWSSGFKLQVHKYRLGNGRIGASRSDLARRQAGYEYGAGVNGGSEVREPANAPESAWLSFAACFSLLVSLGVFFALLRRGPLAQFIHFAPLF